MCAHEKTHTKPLSCISMTSVILHVLLMHTAVDLYHGFLETGQNSCTVLESPGKPVTGSPSILKGSHNALIDESPSRELYLLWDKSSKNAKKHRWSTCYRYTWCLQD